MTLPFRRLAALGAAAAGLLLLPAAAHAAADPVSVTVTSDCDRYGCSNSLKIAPAGQGRLAVALASVGGRRGDLVITAPESAVQLASQAPDCRTVDPRTVRCAATLGTTPTVTGGPQGDLVDGRALAASATVDGGAGDDTLVLGTGGGTLKGGPGHDALDGGSGSGASADFTDHRRGLRIDLGRQRMAGGDAGSQDIEVRDARGRVLRTIRTRVTDALRRRASRFIVALPRGTSEVRVARRRLSPLVEVRRWERTRLRFRVT